MTFEEIVEHYRTHPAFANWKAPVLRRSDIPNAERTLYRSSCICGGCGYDSKVCACGMDRVAHGRNCITCGRPWWCER